MVSVLACRRFVPAAVAVAVLALAALVLVAPEADAVRALDSPDQLPEPVHAYGAAQVDQDIYLFGGGRSNAYLDEITVVRPDGSASTAGQLPEELKSPAAAAHDGQIYIFGGAQRSTQDDLPTTTSAIQRYDPATGEAERVLDASLPDPVAGASALTAGDTIYVLGGLSIQPDEDDQVDFVTTIAAFDPATGDVRELDATLPTGRAQASAVLAGGDILYLGGHAEAGADTCPAGPATCFVPDILRFDLDSESVGTIGELPERVRWSAASVHEGTVYVLGGCQNNCGPRQGSAAIHTVDPSTGEAEALPVTMPVTGGRNQALLHDDVAWIPGGVMATEEGSTDHRRILRVQLGETRPWAPVNLSADNVRGGVALSWDAPSYDGGDDVTSYIVERARGAREPIRLDQVPEPSYRDFNATQGVSYTYQVRAENRHGVSSPSGDLLVRPTETPGPPAVSAQGGDGKLVVQWTPPEDTGGLDITSYRVFAYHPGSDADLERCASACWGKVSNTTTRATITSVEGSPVENGQAYELRVQARNTNGWGTPSEPKTAEARPVPDAPRNLQAQTHAEEGQRSVELSWRAPTDDEARRYVVYRGTSLDQLAEVGSSSERSFRDEGPVPEGEQVLYAVAARNGGAEGPLSQPTTVVFATAPGKVADLSARWTGAFVEVAWSQPNDTGGQPVQAYEVARTRGAEDPEEAEVPIHRTATQRYQDENPERGTPLAYHVRAVTEAGEGPWRFEQIRISHSSSSRPPVAALAAHPTKIDAGQRVVFDASGSEDDEDVVAYSFAFGDGETTGWRSSPRVTYTYEEGGVFDATVTVRDTGGLESTAQATIAVGPAEDPEPNGSELDDLDDVNGGTDDAPLPLAAILAGMAGAALARARRR